MALLMSLLLASPVAMSANDNRFYVYNAANGLADNSAQTVTCTKTGRLVITTMGQINFFDGVKFTYIDPSSENLFPLKDYKGNYHLYFDKYHHLWLKDRGDVTCVNLTTESFVASIEEIFPHIWRGRQGDGSVCGWSECGMAFDKTWTFQCRIKTLLRAKAWA